MTDDRIKEHIKWEWEKFNIEILCTSKQNIFSKALEIVNKKFIYQVILNCPDKFNEKETAVICASDCVIDTIYSNIFLDENIKDSSSEKVMEELHRYAAR